MICCARLRLARPRYKDLEFKFGDYHELQNTNVVLMRRAGIRDADHLSHRATFSDLAR
jgi:hypothetical protein